MQNKTKLHLGCGKRDFGKEWIHVDGTNYPHVDIVTNELNLLPFADETFDLVYASHVIAYYDRLEALYVLTEWNRILKVGGVLRLATPDFEVLSRLYQNGDIVLEQLLGPAYGKMQMGDETIYHKTVYDYVSLNELLTKVGFPPAIPYDWRKTEHAHVDDHSQAYIPNMDKENGTLISLNVEAIKIK